MKRIDGFSCLGLKVLFWVMSFWQGLLFSSYGAQRTQGIVDSTILAFILSPVEIWLYSIAVIVVWNRVFSLAAENVRNIDWYEGYAISCLFAIFSVLP